jgi:Glycosyl transferases group 1/Glycosyltransferase Family 4
MRILHVDSGRVMRGGQWQVLSLINGLRERGHEPVLLARPDGPLFRNAREWGCDVRPVGLARLAGLARSSEVTHVHDAHSHTLAALAGRPFIVSRRVAFPPRRSPLSRWKYGRAAHYIAVSRFVAEVLAQAGLKPERITVVYDGVPMPAAMPPMERTEILAPATHDPMKGADLLAAAAQIAQVGVRFSQTLAADLSSASAFVYISRAEGLGSAILMAMAAGVPVVASRVGGIPEIVDHERTGLLVDNEPREIARALRRLLDDRALAGTLARAARERVERDFPLDAMVTNTIRVYERIAG